MDVNDRARLNDAMARFARGHRDAFPVVFALMWPALRNFASRMLGNSTDADDAAQAALLKVFSRVSDYDPNRDALSWAFAIASFEIKTIRIRQRRRKEEPMAQLASVGANEASPLDQAEAGEMRRLLSTTLRDLSDDDKRLLLEESGEQQADVAAATMRKRKQRALDRLRAVWRSINGPE